MNVEQSNPVALQSHLQRMRLTAGAFLVTVPLAAVLLFAVPHRGPALASPMTVTVVAFAASLWIGFTANRDADGRLERIKRAAAVHGDDLRLLRDHWIVYISVLVRIEVMVIGGVVVALWGLGPGVGVSLVALGGLMIVLTWPSMRKIQLLMGRVRVLRDGGRKGSP